MADLAPETRSSSAIVADQLRRRILSGSLRPGDRLPGETELASSFGVSRSTIREALRELGSQQLLVASRGAGGGTRVIAPTAAQVQASLTPIVGLLARNGTMPASDLLETRVVLEGPAAGLAAIRRTPDQLAAIRAALHPQRGAPPQDVAERSRSFHTAVLDACGNDMLRMLGGTVHSVLTVRYVERAASDMFWRKVAREHRAIHHAIAAGDAIAAEIAMRDHLGGLTALYRGLEDG